MLYSDLFTYSSPFRSSFKRSSSISLAVYSDFFVYSALWLTCPFNKKSFLYLLIRPPYVGVLLKVLAGAAILPGDSLYIQLTVHSSCLSVWRQSVSALTTSKSQRQRWVKPNCSSSPQILRVRETLMFRELKWTFFPGKAVCWSLLWAFVLSPRMLTQRGGIIETGLGSPLPSGLQEVAELESEPWIEGCGIPQATILPEFSLIFSFRAIFFERLLT